MTINALSAARSLCELRSWTVSNLELQKILYVAQMYHLGQTGEPLVAEGFEAWDYGPVVPAVYARAKGFGKGPVPNVFHWIPPAPPASREHQTLQAISESTRNFTPGQLVDITHWEGGAWAAVYQPGQKGIRIPNGLILNEYKARTN
jgi:uncharacterized phage-associated protein